MFHVNGFRVLVSYWAPWTGVEGATASLHTSKRIGPLMAREGWIRRVGLEFGLSVGVVIGMI